MDDIKQYKSVMSNITNLNITKQTPQYYCNFCAKEYKTRNGLEKHVALCEIIYKTKNNKKMELEEDELPSQRRLYQLLLDLSQKYNRLEEKVDEMNKWVAKKKKKINVLEWLNANSLPNITFDILCNKIQVLEEDIEYLFTNTFLDTFMKIFSRTIDELEATNKPIYTFEQKHGLFYIYEEDKQDKQDNQNNHYCWSPLSRENLILFANRLHRKISKALSEWKKNNSQKIKDDDKWSLIYDKTMSKLFSVEIKQDATFNKIKNVMFNYLKTDIKSIVDYEFEFL
jgi:hypothetical protein